MKFVSRSGWGARGPKSVTRLSSARGVKVHYVGSPVTSVPAVKCATGCRNKIRAIQRQHMDGNGWSDIAYNLLVCEHGVVWEGRGARVMSAANGPGLNSGHYAVCALIGSKGLTEPTDALLDGLRDAIEYLRKYGAGNEIKGHRDGYSTSCPGPQLYAWVKAGAPRPKSTNPTEAMVKKLPLLKKGSKGVHVKTMHYLLLARDYAGLDGVDDMTFTGAHEAGIRGLQKAAGIDVDGLVGNDTWAVLLRVA
ncbi:N-acetylmuramoyl-L-alanine amidase [Planomonospora sp. ID67723]|uniref:peptidoglycan recognition protein family protein n=1 Tax=Planomonospora sp. ID67723 TaxID=2738134 RepID=UPI0018C3BC7C|nr:N-acetylmuramoyl-L-alanine amidase [Planomonospora sp. ID67723]MBG0828570.1 N-acetylmuramoyl-L-alanine amidase [Planomonospora sp. ID67723]